MSTMVERRQATTNRLIALQHPMRQAIWRILSEGPSYIAEMTTELGLPRKDIPNVRNHTHRLEKLKCVRKAGKKEVGGRHVVQLYELTEPGLINTDEWEEFRDENPELADSFLGVLGQMKVDHFLGALKAGYLHDDEEWHVSQVPMVLDAKAVADGLDAAEAFRLKMAEIQSEARARRKEDEGAEPIHAYLDLSFFKTPPLR